MSKIFKFNLLAFFIAFVLGMIYVYLDAPKKKLIIKYPTPYNVNKITYKGLTDECYVFDAKEVKCTKDAIIQPIV
jgi:hypothetical protein